MYRMFLRALSILSFSLLVAGAAGTLTAQRASAQTPVYNPYTLGSLGILGSAFTNTANYPYSTIAYSGVAPFVTSYPFPNMNNYQTVPMATSYTRTTSYMPVSASYATVGTDTSSSTPFSANGTTIMGPDHCQLYDSYCAYCTDHPDAAMCKSDPPVPLKPR
jgi:hypothetical protein